MRHASSAEKNNERPGRLFANRFRFSSVVLVGQLVADRLFPAE